ncbi:MAG: cell division protein ZapA, partial [Neofamilia sp.]
MSKNRVQVEIDGITFNVVSLEDEKHITYVTSQVDRAIKETIKANPKLTKTEGIILVAVNLKDQLEKEKI